MSNSPSEQNGDEITSDMLSAGAAVLEQETGESCLHAGFAEVYAQRIFLEMRRVQKGLPRIQTGFDIDPNTLVPLSEFEIFGRP